MGRDGRHFEPFVHVVDVSESSVLMAWGGCFLEPDGTVVDGPIDTRS